MDATLTVHELANGTRYVAFRFDRGNAVVPAKISEYWTTADWYFSFVADGTDFAWHDPIQIVSNRTVAYRATLDTRGPAAEAGHFKLG